MPGARCAVALCNNNYKDSKKNNVNISFHIFPKYGKMRNNWIKACDRGDTWNPKTSTVCSVHFGPDDFEVDLRPQLLNIKTKPRLKPTAVPTKLPRKGDKTISYVQQDLRDRRMEKRLNKKIVEDVLQDSQGIAFIPPKNVGNAPEKTLQETYDELVRDHESLKNKYKVLKEMNRTYKILCVKEQMRKILK